MRFPSPFVLIGITVKELPIIINQAKADIQAAHSADSPDGAKVDAAEIAGVIAHIGFNIAKAYGPAFAAANKVDISSLGL